MRFLHLTKKRQPFTLAALAAFGLFFGPIFSPATAQETMQPEKTLSVETKKSVTASSFMVSSANPIASKLAMMCYKRAAVPLMLRLPFNLR